MAFFKFRKGGDQTLQTSNAVESVDVLRKRAKHRLMGSAILVLAGVIGFPLLFDSQPRPIAVDIPIQIPDKDGKAATVTAPAPSSAAVLPSVAPAAAPSAPASDAAKTSPPTSAPLAPSSAGVSSPSQSAPAKADASKEVAGKEEIISPAKSDKAEKKPDNKADAKHEAAHDSKPAAKADKADKKAATDAGRYVVQVGAYTDAAKLREVRAKLEKAGYKTYAQVVGGSDGKRTRVRIGPFPNKAAAQKVADKIKKLNLPAAILEL